MASKLGNSLRLVTFEHLKTKSLKVGAQLKDYSGVIDLSISLKVRDMRHFLEERAKDPVKFDNTINELVQSGKNFVSTNDIKLKAPIYNPEKVLCIGLNYVDHAKETNMPIPKEPVCFSKFFQVQ